MLTSAEATAVVKKNHPFGAIQSFIEYQDLYIFQVFNNRPGEEQFDPFFSVDKNTGKFAEFSIITDGDTEVIVNLFLEAQQRRVT
jgi:hypothetical protein